MIWSKYFLVALVAAFFSSSLVAGVTLSPAEIEVNDVAQSKKIIITHDDQPVLPADITKIVSGVFKFRDDVPDSATDGTHFSDYSFMFEFRINDDGSITLIPNEDLLEIGRYHLYVHTKHGTATGFIDANLRESNPIRALNPVKWPEFTYDIELPDHVYGQVIAIDLSPDKVNTYTWTINGKVHSSGLGKTAFRAWPEPGSNEISYIAQNPEGVAVSSWSDTTVVTAEETVNITFRKGDKVPFTAPAGFSRVTWFLDGKTLADNHPDPSVRDTQQVKFKQRGTHLLSCKAQDSDNGNFRLLSWSVNVK